MPVKRFYLTGTNFSKYEYGDIDDVEEGERHRRHERDIILPARLIGYEAHTGTDREEEDDCDIVESAEKEDPCEIIQKQEQPRECSREGKEGEGRGLVRTRQGDHCRDAEDFQNIAENIQPEISVEITEFGNAPIHDVRQDEKGEEQYPEHIDAPFVVLEKFHKNSPF